jgi:hypothetical protein
MVHINYYVDYPFSKYKKDFSRDGGLYLFTLYSGRNRRRRGRTYTSTQKADSHRRTKKTKPQERILHLKKLGLNLQRIKGIGEKNKIESKIAYLCVFKEL